MVISSLPLSAGSAGFGRAMAQTQGMYTMDIEQQSAFRAAKALRIADRARVKAVRDSYRLANIGFMARHLAYNDSTIDDCNDDSVIELMRDCGAMPADTLSIYC